MTHEEQKSLEAANKEYQEQLAMVGSLSEDTIRILAWLSRKAKWSDPRGFKRQRRPLVNRCEYRPWIPDESREGTPPEGVFLTSDPIHARRTKTWCMKVLPVATAIQDAVQAMRILANPNIWNKEDVAEDIRKRCLWEEITPVLVAMRMTFQ